MTSAYYFSTESDIVPIEHLHRDFAEVLSLPIPRSVWRTSRRYGNSAFVNLMDKLATDGDGKQ